MSKIIKLTQSDIEAYMKEFRESLASAKIADGKVSFSKTITNSQQKAKIYFSDMAWMKMQALIQAFDKEVAWHGVAHRGDDPEKNEYYITDILVYPQQVSGASVEMDTEEYARWIEENIEDERFCDIRMQGHSHVRMGVTPSSVDLNHQEEILNQLKDSAFYIFMIWNKNGDKNIKIYDLKKNTLFETSDVDVEVLDDGYGIKSFVKDAKTMVRDKVQVGYTTGTSYKYANGYSSSYSSGSYQSKSQTPASVSVVSSTKKEPAKTEQNKSQQSNQSDKKRKGKKKQGNKVNAGVYQEQFSWGEDDYYDAYGWRGYR